MMFGNQSNSSIEDVNNSCFFRKTVQHIRIAIYLLTLIVAVALNSLVILIVCKFCRLRGPINYLIINLAVADMLAPSFAIPRIVAAIYHHDWAVKGPFGDFLCKLSSFAMDMPTAVSIQTLVIMTFDKFHAVVFPMRQALMTTRKCIVAIITIWILACILYSPVLYFWRLKKWTNNIEYCGTVRSGFNYDAYSLFIMCFHTVIPLIILAVLHTLIVASLRRQEDLNAGTHDQIRRRRENRQVWKMLISIFVISLVSWVPNSIQLSIYIYYSKTKSTSIPCSLRIFRIIAYVLLYSYSAGNPFVYFIFIKKYREALKTIFCFRKKKSLIQNGSAVSMALFTNGAREAV